MLLVEWIENCKTEAPIMIPHFLPPPFAFSASLLLALPCGELRLGARTQSVGYGHPKCFQRMFNYLLFWHYCAAHCLNEMPFPWRDSHKWVWNIINKESNLSNVKSFFMCNENPINILKVFLEVILLRYHLMGRTLSLITKEWLKIWTTNTNQWCRNRGGQGATGPP